MGGFVIRSEDLGYGTGVFVLSDWGIHFLAEIMPESIPNIPESEILDKSKASTLAKTIVCLQALWFCIQCIARLSQGASISFLELNVLGHCLCAFATYAIWWKKPTDVSQPTSLSVSDGLREYADVVYLFSGRPGALPTFPTVPGMWSSTAPSVEMPPWYMSPRHESRPGIAFDVSHDQQSFEDFTTKVKFGDLLRSAMFVRWGSRTIDSQLTSHQDCGALFCQGSRRYTALPLEFTTLRQDMDHIHVTHS